MKRYGIQPETLIKYIGVSRVLGMGPQPKGNIIKGLCCQMHRPFLFGVILGQVCARFCFFRVKTGVNGGEGVVNIYFIPK